MKSANGIFFVFLLHINNFIRIEAHFNQAYFLHKYPYRPEKTEAFIDIDTAEAKNITLDPVILVGVIGEKAILENNGRSVTVTIPGSAQTISTGGVLNNKIYQFYQLQFYWSNDINETVGTTIDGKNGASMQVNAIFKLANLPVWKAKKKFGGFAIYSFPVNLMSPKPNLLFIPFGKELKKVQYPGNSTAIPLGQSFAWFDDYLPSTEYYAYPGAYIDAKTGREYHSATRIIFPPGLPLSWEQFQDTFGSLKNWQGKPLTNVGKQGKRNVPVIHSKGAYQILIPFGKYLLRKPPF